MNEKAQSNNGIISLLASLAYLVYPQTINIDRNIDKNVLM